MSEQTPKRSYATLIISLVFVLLLIGVAGGAWYYISQKDAEIETLKEQNDISKKQLEDEYENLAVQYEGFKFTVKNDSLLQKLESEQAKVQRLPSAKISAR